MNRYRWWIAGTLGVLPLLIGLLVQQVQSVYAQSDAPRAKVINPHGPIAIPCQNCHTYTSWKPIRAVPEFNHDRTGYPLLGMHQKAPCTQCHVNLVFKKVSQHCADCHADIHRRKMGANCENCHTVKGWNVSIQQIKDHQNRFPLVGAHALVDCEACHKGAATGQFAGLSTACIACHQKDFQTPAIDHVTTGFPTTCQSCHSMNSWFGASFDHFKYTGFALTGMHSTLSCESCHINNVYKGTPATCFACHSREFNSSNNPPHVALGLPHDCGACHSTAGWLNAKFDHTLYAKYPLTGKHATLICVQCHVNNNYTNTPVSCYSCHQAAFTSTTNPNHVTAGFPTDCAVCHTTSGWIPSSFNHNSVGFALTGAHATVQCAQCHINGNYTNIPKDCYSCHSAKFNNSTNPPHLQLGLPHTCDTCHSTASWANATFDHTLYANYPLTGKHSTLTCVQCHVNNNYTNTPVSCYSCHKADFNGTTNPNHASAGFPTDCSICHSTAGWTPSSFNHNSVGFPLTGAHTTLQCSQCHINGNYTTVPKDCYSCHKANWTSTTNPNHAAAGFPTTCATCHSTTTWAGAVFNHNNTPFPLTGAHVSTPCASCHINNVFVGTPTDCYACHKAQYTGTTNPNHISAGFPTTCATCHTTTAWTGATFNHNWFPTSHGGANGVCATCHTNSANYTVFTCTNCHSKSATDGKHNGVSG